MSEAEPVLLHVTMPLVPREFSPRRQLSFWFTSKRARTTYKRFVRAQHSGALIKGLVG